MDESVIPGFQFVLVGSKKWL